MAFCLVGSVGDQNLELALLPGRSLLGSAADCDLVIDHGSVSRHHAELVVGEHQVEVIDLGSQNGTYLELQRIAAAQLEGGASITFGRVTVRLVTVAQADLEPGLGLPAPAGPAPMVGRTESTLGLKPADSFVSHRLPEILAAVAGKAPPSTVAQLTGKSLYDSLPVLSLEISTGNDGAVLYAARRPVPDNADGELVCRQRGDITVRACFPNPLMARGFAGLVDSAALLVLLATGREPLTAGPETPPSAPALPEPATVDPTVQQLYREALRVARGDVGVLITGESGTGKEVLARYLHQASPRAGRPFVAINCAALPRDLLEAELFGIERAVATGVEARPGRFELADGGTLLLDEIGDMEPETQATILRVLQEREVFRVGGTVPRRADVRIIAATNRCINTLLQTNRFREDLYYRIATWEVELPPLRHRRGDLTNLAAFFLDREARRRGSRIAGISRAALACLLAYRWPGNIRQLEKEMARAALFVNDGGLLTTSHLAPKIVKASEPFSPLGERLEALERQEISRALVQCKGDVAAAAQLLGLGRSTLYRRLKALAIETDQAGTDPDRQPEET